MHTVTASADGSGDVAALGDASDDVFGASSMDDCSSRGYTAASMLDRSAYSQRALTSILSIRNMLLG